VFHPGWWQRSNKRQRQSPNQTLPTAVAFDPYAENHDTGAFILIDRFSNTTVGAGLIDFSLRRASNVQRQHLLIDHAARVQLNGHRPAVLWLPSYQLHGTDFHTHFTQSVGGSPFTCSKRLAHLPMFSSVESAYSNGCRRIVVLDDCEPHYAVPRELLEEYADDESKMSIVGMPSSGRLPRPGRIWSNLA